MNEQRSSKTVRELYDQWWREQTRKGDPSRRPWLAFDAFQAGYEARTAVPPGDGFAVGARVQDALGRTGVIRSIGRTEVLWDDHRLTCENPSYLTVLAVTKSGSTPEEMAQFDRYIAEVSERRIAEAAHETLACPEHGSTYFDGCLTCTTVSEDVSHAD